MKRLSLTTILAVTLSAAMAESGVSQPLLQEGKAWTYDYKYVDIDFNFLSGTAEWKVEGDTLVGTKRMFRMSFSNTEGSTFRQLWHEEGGKVYAYNEERETSALVYDFTLAVGEKVPRHPDGYLFYDGLVVASTDSVLVHGTLRKRMYIQKAETGEKVTWVEGIGNPMLLSEPIAHTVSDGRSYSLVSCSVDGEVVFAKEDFQAPAYYAFLAEGKKWNCNYPVFYYEERHWGFGRVEEIMISGKEPIGGKDYSLVCCNFKTADSNTGNWDVPGTCRSNRWDWEDAYDILHMREEDGRVYVLREDYLAFYKKKWGIIPETSPILSANEDEMVLYDFNLRVGDSYPLLDGVTVVETGVMPYGGWAYPYQLLSNSLLIVEGIGCVNSWGGIVAYQALPVVYYKYGGLWVSFLGYVAVNDSDGNTFEYSPKINEDTLLGISGVPANAQSAQSATYDILGRRVSGTCGTLRPGVYIRNGRKFVAR